MEITNNLTQDLHKAPDWFKQAIEQNYERKETAIDSKKLVYQTLGDSTEAVSYTHLTLPTNREV